MMSDDLLLDLPGDEPTEMDLEEIELENEEDGGEEATEIV